MPWALKNPCSRSASRLLISVMGLLHPATVNLSRVGDWAQAPWPHRATPPAPSRPCNNTRLLMSISSFEREKSQQHAALSLKGEPVQHPPHLGDLVQDRKHQW